MIKSYKFNGWTVSFLEEKSSAKELFEAFITGAIPADAVTVLANGTTGIVRKIEVEGGGYIIKHDLRKKHRFEFLVQSFFVGSNATRQLRKLDKAGAALYEGDGAARVFLTADRICCRCVLESFVLMEYVKGREIYSIPDGRVRYGSRCAKIVSNLHEHDLVHGDIHPGNFMLDDTSGLIRAIDISGKRATAYQRAFDKIRVEEHFGIRLDKKPGFWEKLVRAHLRYRAWRKNKKQEKQKA